MQIVKYSDIKKIQPTPSTTIWEYPTDDKDISGAVAEIHGRYPESGFAINTKFKELVFMLSGNGKIVTPAKSYDIDLGDEILIPPNGKYAWEGQMTIFKATAPKFESKLHLIVK